MTPHVGDWTSILRMGVVVGIALLALWAYTTGQGKRKD
jgi:hypothetical protein